jgi:hypothetical protein
MYSRVLRGAHTHACTQLSALSREQETHISARAQARAHTHARASDLHRCRSPSVVGSINASADAVVQARQFPMSPSKNVRVRVRVRLSVCVCTSGRVHVLASVRACVCVYARARVFVCVCVFLCVFVSLCESACVWQRLWWCVGFGSVSLRVFAFAFASERVCAYACVCPGMCAFVCARVHVFLQFCIFARVCVCAARGGVGSPMGTVGIYRSACDARTAACARCVGVGHRSVRLCARRRDVDEPYDQRAVGCTIFPHDRGRRRRRHLRHRWLRQRHPLPGRVGDHRRRCRPDSRGVLGEYWVGREGY